MLVRSRVYDPVALDLRPEIGRRDPARRARLAHPGLGLLQGEVRLRRSRAMSDVRSWSSKVVHHAVGVPSATASLRPAVGAVGASSPQDGGVTTSGRR